MGIDANDDFRIGTPDPLEEAYACCYARQMELLKAPFAAPLIRKALAHFRLASGLHEPAVLDFLSGNAAYLRFGGEAKEYFAADVLPSEDGRMDVSVVSEPTLVAVKKEIGFDPELVVSCFGMAPDANMDCGPILADVRSVFPNVKGVLLGSRGKYVLTVPNVRLPRGVPGNWPDFEETVLVQGTGRGREIDRELFVWRMFTRACG